MCPHQPSLLSLGCYIFLIALNPCSCPGSLFLFEYCRVFGGNISHCTALPLPDDLSLSHQYHVLTLFSPPPFFQLTPISSIPFLSVSLFIRLSLHPVLHQFFPHPLSFFYFNFSLVLPPQSGSIALADVFIHFFLLSLHSFYPDFTFHLLFEFSLLLLSLCFPQLNYHSFSIRSFILPPRSMYYISAQSVSALSLLSVSSV